MRTVVIVSPDKSDIYFANRLSRQLNVVGIVVENQTPEKDRSSLPRKALKYISRPRVFLKKTLEALDRKFIEPKQDYNAPGNSLDFGKSGLVLDPDEDIEIHHTRGVNAINDPQNVEIIRAMKPDIIAVCGASILKPALIGISGHGVLNLHGGLSQFYRGLFTTDWAIHNREPECVGATVHFVAPGVDDGDVVYQGRPEITEYDNPNTLYEKVVRLGVEMMIRAISDIEQGRCERTKLVQLGDLYLARMFDRRAKRLTWQQIRNGVIQEYLQQREERDTRVINALINDFSGSRASRDSNLQEH